MDRPYELPPMSALVAFEAAARHVSFKAAARELNVTPAAISHQVKALEAELRCALFRRHHRGVDLTETGAYLFVALQRSFETMSDAIGQLRARASRAAVTIRVTTAVSSFWLTPQLARFWREHGDVSVAQMVRDSDAPADDCDLSIHYGDISAETVPCEILFHDQIMAMASPQFAAANPVTRIGDLAALPLIHLEAGEDAWMDWRSWFAALGHHGRVRVEHRVNNYVIALQAAQDSMGAVLGWTGLTQGHLRDGRLVPIWPDRVETPQDFYVRLHPHPSAGARLVFDWLVGRSRQQPG